MIRPFAFPNKLLLHFRFKLEIENLSLHDVMLYYFYLHQLVKSDTLWIPSWTEWNSRVDSEPSKVDLQIAEWY